MIVSEDSSPLLDPLAALLDSLQLRCRVSREWTLRAEVHRPVEIKNPQFLGVLSGCGQVNWGSETLLLGPGELLLFLRGSQNLLSLHRSSHELTVVLCGDVRYLGGVIPPIVHGWPASLPMRSQPDSLVTQLLRQITAVRETGQSGTAVIVDHLVTLAALETLRQQLQDLVPGGPGWLQGLRDAELGPILSQMLRFPGRPWSVESLAIVGQMARSTFARRFRQVVGEAPMDVLTGIRMRSAAELLRGEGTLKEISRQVGYRSVSAFSVAFRRFSGCSPWEYRAGSVTVDANADAGCPTT